MSRARGKAISLALILATAVLGGFAAAQTASVPLVYCTDLFHPHDDPDDHFDLATVFALDEFDIRGIVLDLGQRQRERPGATPVRQMMAITGREVPFAIGLATELAAPDDDGAGQPEEFQGGVQLTLRVLQEADAPVTIVTTGSVRDVTAAYNRSPELLRDKVRRIYVNAGNSSGKQREYNVRLDRIAFERLLTSGLPIYWCPCFPKTGADRPGPPGTWWQFEQGPLFDRLSPPVQRFFAYCLMRAPLALDPIKALREPGLIELARDDWRADAWAHQRNMWCTAPLIHAAGRTVQPTADGGWEMVRLSEGVEEPVFSFEPMGWTFDGEGAVTLQDADEGAGTRLFTINDPEAYPEAMAACLTELLAGLDR